jgi:hypothetical protein
MVLCPRLAQSFLLRDSLPAPKICKDFFKSVIGFSLAQGGDLSTVAPFQPLFHATKYTLYLFRGFYFSREYFHFSFIPPQIDQTQRRIQLANNPASDVTLEP